MAENPLRAETRDWLWEVDFGVESHGFAPHGRDYIFVIEAAATYELTLTHVVELAFETRVRDDVWPHSWSDTFIDYSRWEADGCPSGYVWGSHTSLAYPGLVAPDDDARARKWSERLGFPMYAMSVETDRFKVSMIFHAVRSRKLSDDAPFIRQVIVPNPPLH